jgi:hypothetical protein
VNDSLVKNVNAILLSLDKYTLLMAILCLCLCVLVLARNFDRPLVQKAGQSMWLWRVIMFKYANGSFIVWASAVMAAHLFNPRTESWLGVYLAVSKSWEMFLNQDVEKLKSQINSALRGGYDTQTLTLAQAQAQSAVQNQPVNPTTQ